MENRPRILVVDDDPSTRSLLREILNKEGYDVGQAENGPQALTSLERSPADLVITDIQMPAMDGLELLTRIRGVSPKTLVVLVTAYGSLKTAVDGIKAGAFDYLSKPFLVEEVRLVTKRALHHGRMVQENERLREKLLDRGRSDTLVGTSPAMVSVYKLIARVAQTDATVLIQGESGTGKELVARALHSHSSRSSGPFVAVDCGALAESLLESELFGHERGAFTGAIGAKKGLLERAHAGTCFLDEIGDISPVLQSKLLRVLQEREVRHVGGLESLPVDVRIVAATNKDLKKLVEAGTFREDLYYRLKVVTIGLPPLSERREDIPLLAYYFVQKYGSVQGKPVTGISPEALDLLCAYAWPGNVRDLAHTVEQAVILTPNPILLPEDLPSSLRAMPKRASQPLSSWKPLEHLEREYILQVLEASQGDTNRAADVLGIHRKTLLRKLEQYRASQP